MRYPLFALLAAAAVAPLLAATKEPKPPAPPGGNKPAVTGKKTPATNKSERKSEGKVEAPAAEPVSLVPATVDAATQMALEATKAAQAEVAKLSAIGGKVITPANAKLAAEVINVGAAVAKELTKPKAAEDKEPATEKPRSEEPAKGGKKPAGKKAA